MYNNILPPDQIPNGSNYHIFKEGIKPMWEDPQNKDGGKWLLSLNKSRRQEINPLWKNTVRARCLIFARRIHWSLTRAVTTYHIADDDDWC